MLATLPLSFIETARKLSKKAMGENDSIFIYANGDIYYSNSLSLIKDKIDVIYSDYAVSLKAILASDEYKLAKSNKAAGVFINIALVNKPDARWPNLAGITKREYYSKMTLNVYQLEQLLAYAKENDANNITLEQNGFLTRIQGIIKDKKNSAELSQVSYLTQTTER